MSLFVIRHTVTGHILPVRYAYGGVVWDGQEYKEGPRVFHTRQGASTFISFWVKAKAGRTRDMLKIITATVTVDEDQT